MRTPTLPTDLLPVDVIAAITSASRDGTLEDASVRDALRGRIEGALRDALFPSEIDAFAQTGTPSGDDLGGMRLPLALFATTEGISWARHPLILCVESIVSLYDASIVGAAAFRHSRVAPVSPLLASLRRLARSVSERFGLPASAPAHDRTPPTPDGPPPRAPRPAESASSPPLTRAERLLAAAGLRTGHFACSLALEASPASFADTAPFALLNLADTVARVVEPAVRHDMRYADDILGALAPTETAHRGAIGQLQMGGHFNLIHLEAWLLALRRLGADGRLPLASSSHGRGQRWWAWIGTSDVAVVRRVRNRRNDAAHQRPVSPEQYRKICKSLFGCAEVREWLTCDRTPHNGARWLDAWLSKLDGAGPVSDT